MTLNGRRRKPLGRVGLSDKIRLHAVWPTLGPISESYQQIRRKRQQGVGTHLALPEVHQPPGTSRKPAGKPLRAPRGTLARQPLKGCIHHPKTITLLILLMFKRFFCWIGWHSWPVGFEVTSFDGCSAHASCKWCGYEGMIDGQGNLF